MNACTKTGVRKSYVTYKILRYWQQLVVEETAMFAEVVIGF